jgi:thymidine kinase
MNSKNITEIIAEAELGNRDSQYLIGRAYDEGKLIPRNLHKAMYWYELAAKQGHGLAIQALGYEIEKSKEETNNKVRNHITKIYGPPGTGKTTTLIKKVEEAIGNGVSSDKIGFFSYTNFATEQAKSKIEIESDFPYFQTIHSLAYTALRTQVAVISDQQALAFDSEVKIERPLMKKGDPTSQVVRIKHPVLDAATTARSKKIPLKDFLENLEENQRWPIYKWLNTPSNEKRLPISMDGINMCLSYNDRYEIYKKNLGVIDFADMLDNAIANRESLPKLELLIIDEAQDLSPAQWDIVNILISKANQVFIAGDDDQAICEPFGASAKHFLNAPCHREIILDKSQRIPLKVHQSLKNIIPLLSKKHGSRKEKTWNPKESINEGEVFKFKSLPNFMNFIIKAINTENSDILLMFTTNSSLQKFSDFLIAKNISHYAANELIGNGIPEIRLLSIWGAKGGEAKTTALITMSDMDLRMLKEDPRLEYVAHSRAMESFYYVGLYSQEWVPQHLSDKIHY